MYVPIIAPAAELPDWAARSINLADPRLGAAGLACSDDFFAPLSRMLDPQPAQFIPGKYDDNGKWMDGWETRRKRTTGHDWAIVRLGLKGFFTPLFAQLCMLATALAAAKGARKNAVNRLAWAVG